MTYRMKFWALAALVFGLASMLGAVVGLTVPSSGGVHNPVIALPIVFVAITGLAFVCNLWWQNTDDIQKQGQMISWWWGGTFGAIAALMTLVVWIGWKLRGRGQAE